MEVAHPLVQSRILNFLLSLPFLLGVCIYLSNIKHYFGEQHLGEITASLSVDILD